MLDKLFWKIASLKTSCSEKSVKYTEAVVLRSNAATGGVLSLAVRAKFIPS